MTTSQNPDTAGEKIMSVEDLLAHVRRSQKRTSPDVPVKQLTDIQKKIISRTRVRLLGHDADGDISDDSALLKRDKLAMVAMNNAMLLSWKASFDLAERERARTEGFQVTPITVGKVNEVLRNKGYAFLMEYVDDEGNATPYGSQMGYPHMPGKYPNLSRASIFPKGPKQFNERNSFSIWRTTILRDIERVRTAYERVISISPDLDGQILQGLGAGLATKLVCAETALEMDKKFVLANIGDLVTPNNTSNVIFRNEQSLQSNEQVFKDTRLVRQYTDAIRDPRGDPVLRVIWKIFHAVPEEMVKILTDSSGGLARKGWDTEKLRVAGWHLAEAIQRKDWRMKKPRKGR